MRVGIIGTGWGARVQVPAFRAAGLEVVGLAARSPEKTAAEAARLGVAAFDSWQALVAQPDVDLISIVTPPATHQPITLAALDAGKHVLCEKPTALNAAEAAAMLAAAQAHPTQIALIDHELRFLPAWQLARTIIRRGDLGQLRHVTSQVVNSARADLDRPWTWWNDAAQGGGLWGAIGSHQIDTLRFLWGEIAAVQATLHTFVTARPGADGPQPVTSDDYAAVHLRFSDGALASLNLSLIAALDEQDGYIFHGEEGALRLQRGEVWVAARGGAWEQRPVAETVDFPADFTSTFQRGTVYLGHALRAYGTGNCEAIAPGATFADGLRSQQVLDAGYGSHASGGAWTAVADAG